MRKRINYANGHKYTKGVGRDKEEEKKSSQCLKETGPGVVLQMGDSFPARVGGSARALRRTKALKVSRHGRKIMEGNAEWVAWSGVPATGRPVEALAKHLT